MEAKELEFLSNDAARGELLADRLARGAVAPEEAVRYAIDIGLALHHAHSRDQVHGSLSPHAILLTETGARVLKPRPADPRAIWYRSPEQVAGAAPDSLSDIFSYGAILYEMACGRRAFPASGTELDQAILKRAPVPLMAKSPALAAMEGVIAGCLEKNPARRRQRIHNAVIDLRAGRTAAHIAEMAARVKDARRAAAMQQPGRAARNAPRRTWQRPAPPPLEITLQPPGPWRGRLIVLIALAFLALAATAVAAMIYRHARPAPAYRFTVAPPEHTSYRLASLSPDGLKLVISAVDKDGKMALWLRRLDAVRLTMIEGSEGATEPFWSPDSQSIAFFAHRSLKRIPIAGGTAQTVCATEAAPGGGTWNAQGEILFAPDQGGSLYKVAAAGGLAQPVLTPDPARSQHAYLWPQFLPDGKHFVFFILTDIDETTGVYAGALGSPVYHELFQSTTNAVYATVGGPDSKRGYLLSILDGNLVANPFNSSQLTLQGDAVTMAEDVGAVRSLSLAPISVSNGGVLAFQNPGAADRELIWTDRAGAAISPASEGGPWGPPRVSPDGSRAIVSKGGPNRTNGDLWIIDRNGKAMQFTATPAHEQTPVWSPDGSRVAFVSDQDGNYDLYSKTLAGGTVTTLYKDPFKKYPRDWSRDGKYLLFSSMNPGTHSDIWGVDVNEHRAAPVLDTIYTEDYPALSPDGKWLACFSDETMRNEVYVQPFDGLINGTKRRWKISTDGGGIPHWRADGRELFYTTASGRVMVVEIHPQGSEFGFDQPKLLFQYRPVPGAWNFYDVSPDGQSFILNIPLEWSGASPVTVDTGWMSKLR